MADAAFPQPFSGSRRAAWTQILPRALSMTTAYRSALMALLLVGFLLRLFLLNAFPFREDEAIYSYWALHLTRVDPLALSVWPDKPPIFLWLLGIVFAILGPAEAAARWLNIAVSLLTIPVVAAIARHLWGRRPALLAALFFALNPFAISFAPTAYTDPLLVLFGMIAFHAAITGRSFWAGLFLGAAIMTKQQGILYVPLVIAGAVGRWQLAVSGAREQGSKHAPRATRYSLLITHFFIGLVLILVPILYWDSLRWAVAPSPWDLSVRNYGGFALAPPADWPSRLVEWGSILWFLAGSGAVWAMVLAVSVRSRCAWQLAVSAEGKKERREEEKKRGSEGASTHYALRIRQPFDRLRATHALRTTHYSLLITHYQLPLWVLLFLGFHLITTTQIWDRYLLPLAPVFALGAGAALSWGIGRLPRIRLQVAGIAVVGILLLPPAWTAAGGGFPIGADHGDYAGLDEMIAWLDEHAPENSALYHQNLGWHYRFYFFDANRPEENRFDLRWYPHTVYLADNAAKVPHKRRFLVAPEWIDPRGWERHLAARQIEAVEHLHSGRFTLYELTGPPQRYCDWCVCSER
jgi:hypothetical protein